MNFNNLISSVRSNEVVLWAGSGLSLYAGLPNADFLRELIISNCSDDEKGYFKNKSLGETADLFVELRNGSRNELYNILSSAIDIEPSSVDTHKLIYEIPQFDLIITTNYDTLFEEAYGREISTILLNSDLPLATKRTKLYKIHGDIKRPETILITQADYTNFFRKQDKPLWNKVKSLMAEKTVIFLGYSLADQNINYLFDNILTEVGDSRKEHYLIAPSMPEHSQNALVKKGIHYIDMTAETFIKKVHNEVKSNLLTDIIDNKIDKTIGLNQLKKYGLDASIQSDAESTIIQSLSSKDFNKKFKLDITFDGIDFVESLKKSSTNPLKISGDNIQSVSSWFEDIKIPQYGNVSSMTFILNPLLEIVVDLFFKNEEDLSLSNVSLKVFKDYNNLIFVTLSHENIDITIDLENKKLNYSYKNFYQLKDLVETTNFLMYLESGKETMYLYLRENMTSEMTDFGKEMEFIRMDHKINSLGREHFLKIIQVSEVLKQIQKQYKVRFRDFSIELDNDSMIAIDLLTLHMSKEPIIIEKLDFAIESLRHIDSNLNKEIEDILELIVNQKQMYFESENEVKNVKLFDHVIELNDVLILKCEDAIITTPHEVKTIDDLKGRPLEIRSRQNKITMGFKSFLNK